MPNVSLHCTQCIQCVHTAHSQLEIKPDKRRIIVLADPWWPWSFQNALARSMFSRGCPGVHFIDSMHSALFVTGKRSGIVVDVGYHTTKIQASMHGHILPETRSWRGVGFYQIMQRFKLLMRKLARLDFEKFSVDEHQIEKAIARTCFVQPFKYRSLTDADIKAIKQKFLIDAYTAKMNAAGFGSFEFISYDKLTALKADAYAAEVSKKF